MPEIASLQLFKILSDETRTGIVLLLRGDGGSCAYAISARRWMNPSPRSPVIWRCSGKAVYCWIASRGNGFIIAYPRIFLPGLPGD